MTNLQQINDNIKKNSFKSQDEVDQFCKKRIDEEIKKQNQKLDDSIRFKTVV